MLLTYIAGVFQLQSTYEERQAPQLAGFFWHGGKCKEPNGPYKQAWECKACKAGLPLKVWWTADKSRAARLAPYADDAAKAALAETLASLEASRAVATEAQLDLPLPKGRELLGFQKAGIQYCIAHNNVLLGDEMGLGKTVQAIAAINADRKGRVGNYRVLIICPASLRANWKRELETWLAVRMYIETDCPSDDGITILSYEGAKKHWNMLMNISWDILIVDEAHFCKNGRAQRTRAILGYEDKRMRISHEGLAHKARRRLFLTGTPLPNKPIELWPLLHCLAPEQFSSFWGFAKRYCAAVQGEYGWDLSGASNLEELQQAMRATCLIRRRKRDVLTELPPKRRQVIVLEPTKKAQKLIAKEQDLWDESEAHAAILEEVNKEKYKEQAKALRAHSVEFSEISRVRHELALEKVPQVVDFVSNMLEEGTDKVVIMAHHRDVIASLAEALDSYGVVTLTGDTPMGDRQTNVDAFQKSTERVFIGSITAAGVGLTLTASSNVVFAELDWVPANVTQAEDRCHRIGQHDSVNVYHLVYDGSLDGRMAHILVQKQEVADKALDKNIVPIEVKQEMRPPCPVPSPEQRYAAREGIRFLASVCDGALQLDGHGFNKLDADFGKSLAQKECLSDRQTWAAMKVLAKYKRQLKRKLNPKHLTALGLA